MVDMAMLQGAIFGLKTAGDIAKSLHQLVSSIDVKTKIIELQDAILTAQNSALAAQSEQFTMVQRIRDLEKEIADVKAWEEEKKRYQMVRPWEGVPSFVYALERIAQVLRTTSLDMCKVLR